MPPDGIHGREIVIYPRDGFSAVTLTAGDVAPNRVAVLGLSDVTFLAAPVFIELDAGVRVCQVGPVPHHAGSGTIRKRALRRRFPGRLDERLHAPGFDFVLLVEAGADFPVFVAPESIGHLLLGRSRSGEQERYPYQAHRGREARLSEQAP
jgi:hypothetical protein